MVRLTKFCTIGGLVPLKYKTVGQIKEKLVSVNIWKRRKHRSCRCYVLLSPVAETLNPLNCGRDFVGRMYFKSTCVRESEIFPW